MPCVCTTAGEDNQPKSKDLDDSVAEVDADSSRNSDESCSAADASDEGASLQEQAHVTLPEEAGEEEVELTLCFSVLTIELVIVPYFCSCAILCLRKCTSIPLQLYQPCPDLALVVIFYFASNQDFNLQVLLSVSCIMVSAKRKVAGRLEIMQSSLHFYGEFIVEGTGGRSVFNSTGGFNYPDAVTMEKGFSKPKMSGRKDFLDDSDRGNAMERLDPIQGGLLKGIKRHSRWDLSQVRPDISVELCSPNSRVFFLLFNRNTRLSMDLTFCLYDVRI